MVFLFKFFVLFLAFFQAAYAVNCPQKDKTVICHAGSVNNPNYVSICVDFAALWGHFAHHQMDFYGKCPTQSLDPYACNAGIKHETPQNSICHKKDNYELTDHCDNSENCVCSYANDEQNNLDYMKFKAINKKTGQSQNRLVQADIDEYAEAFTNKEFGKFEIETETLSFNLGSERIGSEYFVDFCIERPLASSDSYELFSSMVLDSSVLTRSPYLEQTDLKLKTSLYCSNDLDPLYDIYSDLYQSGNFRTYPVGGLFIYPVIPKKELCVLRYEFKENSALPYMRKWLHQNVQATVIVDTQEDDSNSDGPFKICHVKKVSNKNYQCTQLFFNNGEEYIQYILQYNNVRDWRQDHQHDYRGACLNTCGPLKHQ